MSNNNTVSAYVIIEELVRNGIDYFCISPGARSAPLTTAVARNPRARSVIVYDERGSAYHALGYARATGKAAAVITTSGTAVANLLPAVTEAWTDCLPMILLTADRPTELLDRGANQTLDQVGIFGKFVHHEADLDCSGENQTETILRVIDAAAASTRGTKVGPVQLNCKFREPLEPEDSVNLPSSLQSWQESTDPFTQITAVEYPDVSEQVAELVDAIGWSDLGIMFVGRLDSEEERQSVQKLIEVMPWPVYTDIASGLRLGSKNNTIRHFDQELMSDRVLTEMNPEFVLHLGGRTTSKRIGLFLADAKPKEHWVISKSDHRYDPANTVTRQIQADLVPFAEELFDGVLAYEQWATREDHDALADKTYTIIGDAIEEDEELTELFVSRQVSASLPAHSGLFLGNSMPIRDMDLYGCNNRDVLPVGVNRGISGIDGIVSTAIGYCAGLDQPVTLILGDVSFLHDLNALSSLSQLQLPLTIVVINNGGGGIFDFLPISKCEDVFESHFVTPHSFSFGGACSTFSIDYQLTATKEEFAAAYRQAVAASRPNVIEVTTSRQANFTLRKKIKYAILEMLEASVKTTSR